MLPMHISDEQSLDSTLMLCAGAGRSAFRMARFVCKHRSKTNTNNAQIDGTLENVCSAYRGGSSTIEPGEAGKLMRELAGNDSLNGEFFFTGKSSDLSFFWRMHGKGVHATLDRSVIDNIADEKLRARVISVLTKARLDGSLRLDGDVYSITGKGLRDILRPDFIMKRLRDECEYLGIAADTLEDERKQRENDRIDKRLRELGRESDFANCDRITLNIPTLYRDESSDAMRFFVPGTARRMTVELPKTDIIGLDDDTFAAFLRRGSSYKVNGQNMPETELFKKFDNKNAGEKIRSAVDDGIRSAQAEEKLIGTKLYILRDGEPVEYEVTRVWASPEGDHLHLKSVSGNDADLLLPADAIDKLAFGTPEQAVSNAAAAGEYSAILDLQQSAPIAVREYRLSGERVEFNGDRALIRINDIERINVPADNVTVNHDGTVTVCLHDGTSYGVQTGDYGYTVSTKGAEKLIDGSKELARTTAEATHGTVSQATSAAVRAGTDLSVAASAAAPGANAVAAAVNAISKAVSAAQTAGEVASQTLSLTRKL